MQPLQRTLQDHDLGHLRILAELWGFDLPTGAAPQVAATLAAWMLSPSALVETVSALEPAARQVLDHLVAMGGRAPFADLTRRFGPLRELGPGRRDREKPWRSPVSPLEVLWYRGLLARAFADTPTGASEFGFIPSDILALFKPPMTPSLEVLGSPAPTPSHPQEAALTAVEDATTLLAGLRRRPSREDPPSTPWLSTAQAHLNTLPSVPLLLTLLREMGIVQATPIRPNASATKSYLELPRGLAHDRLLAAWRASTAWNDLAHVPWLEPGADRWPNDPLASRATVLGWLRALPNGVWWDLGSFIRAVKANHPGFQRPGGDFDSWYLRDARSGEFLRGFEYWDQVEGAYLEFVITGPLHWLGASDLAADPDSGKGTAFRLTDIFHNLMNEESTEVAEASAGPCALQPDGRLFVPRLSPRPQRYLIARFCAWLDMTPEGYGYRLTPRSLEAAARQGLKPAHILTVLETAISSPLPPATGRAIERALRSGPEAVVQRSMVLRVETPRLLDELRRHRSTARYLGEPLGPRTALVRERDWEALCAAAARLGLLIEPPDEAG